jgi:hypothetical protein
MTDSLVSGWTHFQSDKKEPHYLPAALKALGNRDLYIIHAELEATNTKHMHVFLNGEDVTARTFMAGVPRQAGVESQGFVGMFKRDVYGALCQCPTCREPQIEKVFGLVRWEYFESPETA